MACERDHGADVTAVGDEGTTCEVKSRKAAKGGVPLRLLVHETRAGVSVPSVTSSWRSSEISTVMDRRFGVVFRGT